ncbi:hypothetical protein KFL_012260020 [Klebsormidium nitens]|uniref:Small ribosomal subunit protein mS29 n=1 Tax=Klebsormidium nitens TaxID=105231 RepID=A0A1Y1IQK6_KLENI|nr:hypothetical protein KFL_012260020 [Klebsormidium nitens]|eukprot:GAQ92963.1 hypothetical protein KFL_012260020 [Klebsormidium nitens]
MALPTPAQFLVPLPGEVALLSSRKGRCLRCLLCASTSRSSVLGPNSYREKRACFLDDTEHALPMGAPISVKLAEEARGRHADALGEGVADSLEKEFAQQKEKRILVRRQGLDLFEKVKQRVEDRKAYQYRALVLKGPKGSGKSSLLALLVHQCRAAGWLALYVPSGTSWISGWFYGKDEKSVFFDTPVQAEKALQALLAAHGKLLESLPIRVPLSAIGLVFGGTSTVDLDTEELATGTPEEGSLKSLVEKGLENQGERAGEMLVRLRIELTSVTEVPVLIAIDETAAARTYLSVDFQPPMFCAL